MAAADPPAGLMDIASTLSQDEIPFKLRCAICNKLAVNAFRLPCCDQSICEPCQASLPDTCSVCAHSPLSPDLCKPNKALRTTLKAFLRTEEKKREKERHSAAPTPVITTPAENDATPTDPVPEQKLFNEAPIEIAEIAAPVESKPVEAANEAPVVDTVTDPDAPEAAALANESETNGHAEPDDQAPDDQAPDASTVLATDTDAQPATNGDELAGDESAPKDPSEQSDANMMKAGPAGFPGMGGWSGNTNFNGMNPYMANPMFNFPNGMGMPMTMDQMAANQGMYGMNMTGMGMNMGMNFNGQGMYGSSGWDGSQQNMWQGGQDKFNPNAFANGTGSPYGGGAFGGSNMSFPSNSDYQSGYYGPGYGRGGGYRGRGRGYYHGGPGRGGYGVYGGSGQDHFASTGNSGLSNGQAAPGGGPAGTDGTAGNIEDHSQMNENAGTDPVSNGNAQTADGTTDTATETDNQGQQLQGIPTIDSLDQASGPMEPNGYQNHIGPGYGRGGYMRGPMPGGRGGGYWGGIPNSYQPQMPPQNPGVEGAPAAPRAMRQGLPNTSVLRQRGFHAHGKASVSSNTPTHSQRGNSEAPQDVTRTRSPSKAPSQAQGAGSRSRSSSQGPASQVRSPDENRASQRETTDSQRPDTMRQPQLADRRSRSPSKMSSRRSSRRRDRDEDRERRSGHRSHRSRRHHSRGDSRSRSPARNGESRHPDRLKQVAEEKELNGHNKVSSDTGDRGDLASRISNGHRSGRDGHSRRGEDRQRDRDHDRARDSRRRDKDRQQDRRDRDRDSERDRRQTRDRERDRDRGGERERDRGRDHGADRERERKRRRDRSESPNATTNTNDRSSQPQARRVKTNGGERNRDQPSRAQAAKSESEKDPYTLEREARDRERLLREQQNRGSVKSSNSKSSHRRDSRQERLVGGRRINYKYEDEL